MQRKKLKKKAEGEEIGSVSTKKARQEEAKPIDIEAKAKEGGAKSKAAAKPKAMVKTIAEEVATIEAKSKGASKAGVSKGLIEVVATVNRKKK